jgi:hypothetical protein
MTQTLILIGLRAAALALELSGKGNASQSLYLLADAAEAGRDVEAHMQEVAAKLKAGPVDDADWADTAQRIRSNTADLNSPPTGIG